MSTPDEYTDHTCSTPLERLSRDIQTLLRSWHIVSGSDRHVSFHRKQNRGSAWKSSSSSNSTPHLASLSNEKSLDDEDHLHSEQEETEFNTMTTTTTTPRRNLSFIQESSPRHSSPLLPTLQPSPVRRRQKSVGNERHHAKTSPSPTTTNSTGVKLIRSGTLTLTTTPPNSLHRPLDRIEIPLTLSLWDGPPINPPPPSSSSSPSTPTRSGYTSLPSPHSHTTTPLTAATLPLSLRTYRGSTAHNNASHKEHVDSHDVTENLSSLLGIGQHLTLTPADATVLRESLVSTTDALLRLRHPGGRRGRVGRGGFVSPTSLFFSASVDSSRGDLDGLGGGGGGGGMVGEGPMRSASGSAQSLPPAPSPASSSHGGGGGVEVRVGNTPKDRVSVHSAALHSLSMQLQSALNIALAECDCRIPAFGIWGLYRPADAYGLEGGGGGDEENETATTRREYVMAVPDWMNGGNLVGLAEESSPCFALMRYLKKTEEEERMKKERRRKGVESSRGSSTSLSTADGSEHGGDSSDHGRPSSSTSGASSSLKSSKQQQQHSATFKDSVSPSSSAIGSSLLSPAALIKSTIDRASSTVSGGSGVGGSRKGRHDRLYLPAFLMGYCHSGPGILAKGATFAIHFVPAGIEYPIHCTTLNSLGQLLLQHCPPPASSSTSSSGGGGGYGGGGFGGLGDGGGSISEDGERGSRDESTNNLKDLSFYGKVEVVWARHKYTWSKLFEFGTHPKLKPINTNNPSSSSSTNNTTTEHDGPNVWTFNMPWRKCCDVDIQSPEVVFLDAHVDGLNLTSTAVVEYRKQCRAHALRMICRIMALTRHGITSDDHQTSSSSSSSSNTNTATSTTNTNTTLRRFEPLWGAITDPILSVAITTTWTTSTPSAPSPSPHEPPSLTPPPPRAPLLTLPLRIRSQRTMSSQDVLEMENTILSHHFNPLVVPEGDFSVLVTPDPYAPCNTLGAGLRCVLAALLRVSTLEGDALLGNLTKGGVLQKMEERKVGEDAALELMDKAGVGNVTRKLVEVMDWGSMASEVVGREDQRDFEEKLDGIVRSVLDGFDMRGYPRVPEGGGEGSGMVGGGGGGGEEGDGDFGFRKAESPGRLLSVLFSSMLGLRWPSAMVRLWLKFVEQLRERWEAKKSLQNLGRVPGLDTFGTATSSSLSSGRNNSNTATSNVGGGQQRFKMIGHAAKDAAYVHSSEPNPNLYGVLISQKLQVFNIGVETMIVREEEEERRRILEFEARLKDPKTIDEDEQDGDDTIDCSQSEAATEVRGNTNDRVKPLASFGGIQENKEWCSQSEAATEVIGNIRYDTKHSAMGDSKISQITETDTTESGPNSFPMLSTHLTSQTTEENDHLPLDDLDQPNQNDDNDSGSQPNSSPSITRGSLPSSASGKPNSVYSSDSKKIPMMFNPNENKFYPITENQNGDIILNRQLNNDGDQSSFTGTFYDAFTSIETNTYDNKSRYVISSDGGKPEIEDDLDYDFTPFEEPAISVANRNPRKGIRCPVLGSYLVASGANDQVYAPYLHRPDPVTDELLLEQRNLLTTAMRYGGSAMSVKSRLEVAHRFDKPKLLSDMSAFKAANPGCIFHDFVLWYGNPDNPLQLFGDEADHYVSGGSLPLSDGKSQQDEAEDAAYVLNATRDFWSDTWDEAEPTPASEQIPLFDAFRCVEMILMSFEGMHPAQLLNQILAVNFAMADFILSSSKPVYHLDLVNCALKRLARNTEEVLKMLNKDLIEDLKGDSPKTHQDYDGNDDLHTYAHITPETVAACESLCDQIGSVENLLSRAASLLTKFSGDVNLVEQVLKNPGCHYAASSHESRSGILNDIQCQQQRNSGTSSGAPLPSVREYILRNRDDCNPCQLTVSIGGTHGLEEGGTNSTKGGLVLALNKCVSGAH